MRENKSKSSVYGAGLVALDLVIGADPGSPVKAWVGGTCGNILTILSSLGWDAYPITRLGVDPASKRIKEDLTRWGVHLDLSTWDSVSNVPIIVQEIYHCDEGAPKHRFTQECPNCGHDLPKYKPVPPEHVDRIAELMQEPKIFFVDRLSRSTIKLAHIASERGAVVVYEPSLKPTQDSVDEILNIAHIVKYSDERLSEFEIDTSGSSSILLEVQTLGARGLRYRYKGNSSKLRWTFVPGFDAPKLLDSCGSGDWCTAGVLSKLGVGGKQVFKELSLDSISEALSYGQALAAWNCGFEGARGGMYSEGFKTLSSQVRRILRGRPHVRSKPSQTKGIFPSGNIPCPSCDHKQVSVNT